MFPWSSAAVGSLASPKRILRRCACCLVRAKMMALPPDKGPPLGAAANAMSTASLRAAAAAPFRRTTSCRKSLGACKAASAARRTGCLSDSEMSDLTPSLKVALNNMVCRLRGASFTISWISSLNPISRRRSASSKTSTAKSSKPTLWVLRRWSIRRPGVATTTSGWRRSTVDCTWTLRPPTIKATESPTTNSASFSHMLWT
mmetsp:Transcript_24048/g.42962  ORF Transcript_24048/g.42962 Transcript_24048/m.42962 type:complete len:202 (-) Transcript_24048:583-1188(-)